MTNTYTLAEYKTWTRNRIGDDAFDGSLLLQFANDTNREIINSRRWHFMEETFNGALTTGVASYLLPTDFQAAVNFSINSPDASATFLNYMPFEQFDELYPDPTALTHAKPTIWTTFGSNFMVGEAAPDQAYTLQLRYLKSPTTITGDADTIDIPDEFAEVVVLGMYRRALLVNDSFDQAQLIAQEYDLQLANMEQRLSPRQLGQSVRMRTGRGGDQWL